MNLNGADHVLRIKQRLNRARARVLMPLPLTSSSALLIGPTIQKDPVFVRPVEVENTARHRAADVHAYRDATESLTTAQEETVGKMEGGSNDMNNRDAYTQDTSKNPTVLPAESAQGEKGKINVDTRNRWLDPKSSSVTVERENTQVLKEKADAESRWFDPKPGMSKSMPSATHNVMETDTANGGILPIAMASNLQTSSVWMKASDILKESKSKGTSIQHVQFAKAKAASNIIVPESLPKSYSLPPPPPASFFQLAFLESASPVDPRIQKILEQTFKLKTLRSPQDKVIAALLESQDVLLLAPTGGGKSLAYQLPAVYLHQQRGALTLVVSPLLALMQNQLDYLKLLNIPATTASSSQTVQHNAQLWHELETCRDGCPYAMLYITPESLATEKVQRILTKLNSKQLLGMLAVDEAHCISSWGHDFRVKYRELGKFKEQFPKVPILAATATATEKVKADILTQLRIPKALLFCRSFNRRNIRYQVRYLKSDDGFGSFNNALEDSREKAILQCVLEHPNQCGILYARTRASVDSLTALFHRYKISALAYHAGLKNEQRLDVQSKWQSDECKIVVATTAFGMGVDKQDVRFVIHADIPASMEQFYQESGRAGRDGQFSVNVLCYSKADKDKLQFTIAQTKYKDEKQRTKAMNNLDQMFLYADSLKCRRGMILSHFGEELQLPEPSCKDSAGCDFCLNPNGCKLEKLEATKPKNPMVTRAAPAGGSRQYPKSKQHQNSDPILRLGDDNDDDSELEEYSRKRKRRSGDSDENNDHFDFDQMQCASRAYAAHTDPEAGRLLEEAKRPSFGGSGSTRLSKPHMDTLLGRLERKERRNDKSRPGSSSKSRILSKLRQLGEDP